MLGLPYGTHKWKIGDSLDQNEMFSMEFAVGKREMFQKKVQFGLPGVLERVDIVTLVSRK